MARPILPVGTWGKITSYKQPNGVWRASARFRNFDGTIQKLTASGSSSSGAERRLMAILVEHTANGTGDVTPSTTIRVVGDMWLDEIASKVSGSTLDEYKRLVHRRIVPALGELRVRELKVGAIDRFLRGEAARTPAQARNVQSALRQMMGVAIRHDAILTNPVRDSSAVPRASKSPRALDDNQILELRTMVRLHRTEPGISGPRPGVDMIDFIDLCLATGARIGELLALRWEDLNLEHEPALMTISATLVEETGVPVYRKPWPKTTSGFRVLSLPRHAVELLQRRQAASRSEWVFATKAGTVRAPQNIHRALRETVKGTDLAWVTPHILRKTVATQIDESFDADNAAKQLGHSGPEVTRRYYIQKPALAPNFSETLNKMFDEVPE